MKNIQSYCQNNLVSPVKTALKNLVNADYGLVKQQFDLLQVIQSDPEETLQVMGYLQHQQDMWMVLREDEHFWYDIAKNSAETLLKNAVPLKSPTFFVHFQSRWTFIMESNDVIPAIFLFTQERNDGLALSFYRIFGGESLSPAWMTQLRKYLFEILELNPVEEKEELPSYELPMAGIKWSI